MSEHTDRLGIDQELDNDGCCLPQKTVESPFDSYEGIGLRLRVTCCCFSGTVQCVGALGSSGLRECSKTLCIRCLQGEFLLL
jgi:hypothetical protein